MSTTRRSRAARAALLAIYERDGKLTPEAVVIEAQDPSSPLHGYFDWDIENAAWRWWLRQAEHLIQRFKITIEVKPERTVRVRMLTHVKSTGTYMPTQEAVTHHKDEVFETCVGELAALRAKYENLVDVESAWRSARARARRRERRASA